MDEKILQKQVIKNLRNKKNIKKVIKECVIDWCENTTSHGFSNLVRTDSWPIRILWLIIVIISMGYCFYS